MSLFDPTGSFRRAMQWMAGLGSVVLAVLAGSAAAQDLGQADVPEPAQLVQVSAAEVEIPAGGQARARVTLAIAEGWHVNANPPALDYLIPTEASVTGGDGLTAGRAIYPKPKKAKLAFEDADLLVYDRTAVIEVPIEVAASAKPGARSLSGQIRFQACNDQVCLAPATIPFRIPVRVAAAAAQAGEESAGGGGGSEADTSTVPRDTSTSTPPGASGLMSGPPSGASPGSAGAVGRRLQGALQSGALVWFLALFVGGLLLNLTPCVFPMLGVTVSVFGARRKEPLPKVMVAAALYVLGIVVMYSTLGVVAALTGSLFGSVLQNAWVSVALGLLMLGLSLSMFGLYEMQPPAWLMARLGGASTTSGVGLFLSGLAVGIIAAPCVGPFVVAVLALIAQRGQALFGFQTMFALALGLGLPYLFLAMFSNLLQRLPRSGDWMTWVKKAFGVILAGVGLFYVLLGLAPDWAIWVLPGALVVGGLYLGFVDKSVRGRPGFQRLRLALGSLAVLAGVVIIVTTPRQSVAFQEFTREGLAAGLSSGRTAMIDFSADWCVPCHELEHNTFTDPRVRTLAKSFLAYKVDLTRYDSPESEALRKQYGITGVPTLLFLAPDGREIVEARVEGFIPPDPLLERMHYVGRQTGAKVAE